MSARTHPTAQITSSRSRVFSTTKARMSGAFELYLDAAYNHSRSTLSFLLKMD
jgi:hypothetical protein